ARVVDDYDRLPAAPQRHTFAADRSGFITRLDAEHIGRATMLLGAGRERVDDRIDFGVGAMVRAKVGEAVKTGAPIIEFHYRDATHLQSALDLIGAACDISESPPAAETPILETII